MAWLKSRRQSAECGSHAGALNDGSGYPERMSPDIYYQISEGDQLDGTSGQYAWDNKPGSEAKRYAHACRFGFYDVYGSEVSQVSIQYRYA